MNGNCRVSLVISTDDMAELRRLLFTIDGCENFAVLFCGVADGNGWKRLLVREIMETPVAGYRKRLDVHLEIEPAFLNRVVDHALATGLTPVVVHSHPGAVQACYSQSDDYGERRLLPVLQQLLPHATPASLLFSEESAAGRFLVGGRFHPFAAVAVRGLASETFAPATTLPSVGEEFDRVTRAVGRSGVLAIRRLRVGIVGLGGTGSAIAEQMVRYGVEDFILIDPDRIEESNLPRVWGAVPGDAVAKRQKVDVIADHLHRIRSGSHATAIADDFSRQPVLKQLRDRDIVFGCTDNHLSRAVLNRFAHQYLVPVVDMGARLDARSGTVSAAGGRVTLVGQGLACLICSGHVDPRRVREETLPPLERESLAVEGYVQGIDDPQPAVVSLNTTVASLAATAAVSLFTNLVGSRPAIDQIVDFTNASLFAVTPRHSPACDICSADGGLKALGDAQIVSAYA